MGNRSTQKEKRKRAFGAYCDLLDTADWMRAEMRGPLESFDLTMSGFRLLELLYREGAMSVVAAAQKRQCNRQNMDVIVRRLQERGWVRYEVTRLPPAEIKESHLPKTRRGRVRQGCRVGIVRLTPLGEKFIGVVFLSHAKVVKALMRALHGREQKTLSRLCGKLREGDAVKFLKEMMFEDLE